jgi:hypothetical protein
MTEPEFLQFRATQMGMIHALQVSIRALVAACPNPEGLVREFATEHHESMSLLLASPYPDAVMEGYKDCLRGCAPNPHEWLEP